MFVTHDMSVVRHISHNISVMYLGQVVEAGSAKELFEKTLHPYSKALLSAIPSIDIDKPKKLMSLQQLKAGAGSCAIQFPATMFPTDLLVEVQDNPWARILVLDAEARAAIVSLELENVEGELLEAVRREVALATGTPYDNVWVHVPHALTTPHAPGGPNFCKLAAFKPQGGPPGGFKIDPEPARKRVEFKRPFFLRSRPPRHKRAC